VWSAECGATVAAGLDACRTMALAGCSWSDRLLAGSSAVPNDSVRPSGAGGGGSSAPKGLAGRVDGGLLGTRCRASRPECRSAWNAASIVVTRLRFAVLVGCIRVLVPPTMAASSALSCLAFPALKCPQEAGSEQGGRQTAVFMDMRTTAIRINRPKVRAKRALGGLQPVSICPSSTKRSHRRSRFPTKKN
jgi:hypothetical protein